MYFFARNFFGEDFSTLNPIFRWWFESCIFWLEETFDLNSIESIADIWNQHQLKMCLKLFGGVG